MTQERFLRYLSNPELLATISYEELKTLALTYPYANNLRYLLALKAGREQHPDFERNLATAAAYSLDRTRLFALAAPMRLMPQAIEREEVVLELMPIETVQRELEARQPIARQEPPAPEIPLARVLDTPSPTPPPIAAPVSEMSQPDDTNDDTPMAPEEKPEAPKPPAVAAPTAAAAPTFGAWISQFSPPALATAPPPPQPIRPTPVAPELKAEPPTELEPTDENNRSDGLTPQKLAERSVTESRTIVSETLAKLYVQQGYREKALDMYERLCLAFPDKSAYFAAEIEKLKK